ncbi:MAG: hypothetical protein DRP09_11055 [Candidatus Thorarchaeota archaeon]|nr:MAG: hypothetical protein DRP09_11055 [Candidatus Thorarchaeota archaeon]
MRPHYKELFEKEKKMRNTYLIIILFLLLFILIVITSVPLPLISPLPKAYVRAYETVLEVEKEVDLPPCEGEKCEIMDYIVETFEGDALDAFNVLKCENGHLNPTATNYNRNGTWDTGVFQINQAHGYSLEQMQDPHQNIDAAFKIFERAGRKWTAWTCSHRVFQKNYLGQ